MVPQAVSQVSSQLGTYLHYFYLGPLKRDPVGRLALSHSANFLILSRDAQILPLCQYFLRGCLHTVETNQRNDQVLNHGVGQMLASVFIEAQFSVFILGFLIAAITRVAQGSATVAMITGAGLMAPILELQPMSAPSLGLLVIAISSGATILSHVNDSGFWLVSRYLGLSEKDTLKTWTVMTTLISLVGLASCLVISLFL